MIKDLERGRETAPTGEQVKSKETIIYSIRELTADLKQRLLRETVLEEFTLAIPVAVNPKEGQVYAPGVRVAGFKNPQWLTWAYRGQTPISGTLSQFVPKGESIRTIDVQVSIGLFRDGHTAPIGYHSPADAAGVSDLERKVMDAARVLSETIAGVWAKNKDNDHDSVPPGRIKADYEKKARDVDEQAQEKAIDRIAEEIKTQHNLDVGGRYYRIPDGKDKETVRLQRIIAYQKVMEELNFFKEKYGGQGEAYEKICAKPNSDLHGFFDIKTSDDHIDLWMRIGNRERQVSLLDHGAVAEALVDLSRGPASSALSKVWEQVKRGLTPRRVQPKDGEE